MSALSPCRIALSAVDAFAETHPLRTRYAPRAYAEARERGESVLSAVSAMREADDALAVLAYNGYTGGYVIDAAELARVTSAPRSNITTADGEPVTHVVRIPDGITATLYVDHDDEGDRIDEGDCYSEADVAAWRDDRWRFALLRLVLADDDGNELSTDYLGGVEVGDHWPGTEETQVWHAVPDMVAEALHPILEREEAANAEAYAVAAHVAKTRDARIALRAALRAWESSDISLDDPRAIDDAATLADAVSTYLATLEF